MNSLAEASASVDEALTVYRTSTSGWETADEYFRNAGTHHANHKVADPGVQLKSMRPLPSIFTDQYNNIQYRSYMGLFPQINRAWLTIDSKLFLWAYASSPSQGVANDFFVFEELSQIIVSVALVPPRKGVFVESVRYLVAVATTVEVTLLGVTFSKSGEVSLLPTHLSIPTDNVMMLKIVATPEGRIFMAGADGALHEFVYDARTNSNLIDLISGRPTKRARKVIHGTSKLVNMFLPSAFKSLFARSDGIVDLALEGNALYTLSQNGLIGVYDISAGANCVATVNAKQEAKSVIFSVPSNDREFVSIHTVSPTASNSVQLVLVTSFGERIYYSVCGVSSRLDRSARNSKIKPKTLRYVSFRPSPDKNIKTTRPCVHMAWCENGTAVLADLRENESDRLITIFPDAGLTAAGLSGSDARPTTMKTAEVVFDFSLGSADESRSYNPSENVETPVATGSGYDGFGSRQKAPKRTFAIAGISPDSQSAVSDSHEAPNLFWVLTSSAMHLYERVQPIDRLREILSAGGGSHADIGAFFTRHGAVEACSVCLEISISNPKLSTTAAKVFYTYGSEMQLGKSQKGNEALRGESRERIQYTSNGYVRDSSASGGFDIGRPSIHSTPLPRFSGAHDGLTWYLAKILHPIWTQRITADPDPNAYQYLSASREVITSIREKLLSLIAFLEKYPSDMMLPDVEKDLGDEGKGEDPMLDSSPSGRSGTTLLNRDGHGREQNIVHRGLYQLKKTSEARRAEAQSIISLQSLISRSTEGLALLMILSDHQIHRLAVSMPSETRQLLATMRFCDLVVSREGRVLSSALIEAIFSSYRDGATAVSTVGRMLQDRCPSYFGDADVDLHRALALLKQAVQSVTNVQFEAPQTEVIDGAYDSRLGMTAMASGPVLTWTTALKMAEEAAKMFKQVPDRIFDIPSLCEDFKAVQGELPFIDVALTIGKSAEAKGNEDRAKQAYKYILEVLKSFVDMQHERKPALKGAIMQTVLTAKSEVFLQSLYEFLLQTESGRDLITAQLSPNLERFLEEKQAWDVLWKYCARHERYLEAAGVLLNLCESDSDMGLVDRLNQLSCALHSAKTALSKGDNRANLLLAEITDFMDVAKVQLRVKEELKRHHPPSEKVNEALRELDAGILNLSTLFNRYARPYNLYEACLEAFRCGSHRDDAYVRGLWREIIQREFDISSTPSAVADRVHKLGREFYPCDFVFPVSFVMEVMELLAFENRNHGPWGDIDDWVVSTMKGIGIPLCDVIEGYRKMMESSQLSGLSPWSWSDNEAQFHLLEATERAISAWNRERRSMKIAQQTTAMSESDKVQRTITLCKSKLRALSDPAATTIMERFEVLERHLSDMNVI
ncbi:Nucleoporin [Gracilaria domingensis]|nr:Nucleoporin [Gracilaria domingensis]